MDMIYSSVMSSIDFMREAAPYMLLGILGAGLVHVFVNRYTITSHLGGRGLLPVLKAAVMGIPLPVCSCGIVPIAGEIRKRGGSAGSTVSFLVSTPESGIDSISISFALLDPIMTIARPVSAFVSAVVAGLLADFCSGGSDRQADAVNSGPCGCDGSCCGSIGNPGNDKIGKDLIARLVSGFRYSMMELWPGLAPWFFAGSVIGGIVTGMIPDDMFSGSFKGVSGMVLMLLCSIPVYICASASTPVAAALLMKGVSPGAALVFLLAGPATNMASIGMLISFLGKKITLLYVMTIASVAVICGVILDGIYDLFSLDVMAGAGGAAGMLPDYVKTGSLLVMLLAYLVSFLLTGNGRWRSGQ